MWLTTRPYRSSFLFSSLAKGAGNFFSFASSLSRTIALWSDLSFFSIYLSFSFLKPESEVGRKTSLISLDDRFLSKIRFESSSFVLSCLWGGSSLSLAEFWNFLKSGLLCLTSNLSSLFRYSLFLFSSWWSLLCFSASLFSKSSTICGTDIRFSRGSHVWSAGSGYPSHLT